MIYVDVNLDKIDINWRPGVPGGAPRVGFPWDPRLSPLGPWALRPLGPFGPWGPIGPWGPRPLGIHWPLGSEALRARMGGCTTPSRGPLVLGLGL